jgi:WD40 repeat protein
MWAVVRTHGWFLAAMIAACDQGGGQVARDAGPGGSGSDGGVGSQSCGSCDVPNVCCDTDDPAAWCGEPSCLEPLATFTGIGEYSMVAEWSPVDDYVLSGGIDELRLLEIDLTARTLTEVAPHVVQIGRPIAAWSRDGQYALSAAHDIRLFRVSRDPPELVQLTSHPGHGGGIYAMAWSPDQTHALVTGEDGVVHLFEVDGKAGLLAERAIFTGHSGKVVGVSWGPDGEHAVSVGYDTTVRLLEIDTAAPEIRELASATYDEEQWSVSWSQASGRLLSGSGVQRNGLQSWSVDPAVDRLELDGELLVHTSGVGVISWSPDGNYVVTGGHDDSVRLFAVSDDGLEPIDVYGDHLSGVHAFSWSPDQRHGLLVSSQCDLVTLVDLTGCDLDP